MIEYFVVENPPNAGSCTTMLNDLAKEGWEVIGFSQYQICLEREKEDEEQTVEQING